ncbi:MAG: transposase [Halobacteriota archaeon]
MKEARKVGVKVVTRLNSNFVVARFGVKFRKEDILNDIKPIRRRIDGKSYIIYPFKRCIWQGTAGNLFLVRGEGYDDFIPLFTISLNAKPETVIMKYTERTPIEQTNKELKSYLGIEGNNFKKKESNYGYIFLLSLIYNLLQYLRLYFDGMSFKDVLEQLSFYLLWKSPPKSVYSLAEPLNRVLENIGSGRLNKINVGLLGPMAVSESVRA